MKIRNALWFFPILILLLGVAFLLRGLVESAVIIPLARFIWLLKGYYGSFPQAVYWMLAVGAAVLIAIAGFRLPEWAARHNVKELKPLPGTVGEMAFWIQRSQGGIYPKWLIAHLLADLALDMLDRRGTRQKNTRQIMTPDWSPPEEIKKYLEAALTTNYTDYPKPKRFGPQPPTPFDMDLEPVVKYLESLLESEHDPNH